jgi:hypothetical protein
MSKIPTYVWDIVRPRRAHLLRHRHLLLKVKTPFLIQRGKEMDVGNEEKKPERLRQVLAVLKKITGDLGIPYTSPEVQELKAHFDVFVATGEPWCGEIDFGAWDRIAVVELRRSGKVEVTLKPTPALLRKHKRKAAH